MSTGHAKLSPSGADRWMLCPGSVVMEEGLPDTSSSYADEGTAAHFLASESLGRGATFAPGAIICVYPEGARWAAAESVDPPSFKVDDDMAGHVQRYIDLVQDIGGTLFVEQKLSIAHLTGEDGATGTSDAVILLGDELIVVDLKYGMGNRVEAAGNRQLMMYALAALAEFGMVTEINRIRLIISQPRLSHVSEHVMTVEELGDFAAEVGQAADVVQLATKFQDNWLDQPDAGYLQPGDAQCKWCKAKSECPALARFVQEQMGCEFDDLTSTGAAIADISTDRVAALGQKLRAVGLVEEWCMAVRGAVEGYLFEHNNSPEVTAELGYKLVQGKKGNRAWRNADEAEALLKKMRVKHDEMYDYKLISPTTAEKLAKAKTIGERQWPKVQELIVQAEGKPSVAPISDRREALVLSAKADDFEDVSGASLL